MNLAEALRNLPGVTSVQLEPPQKEPMNLAWFHRQLSSYLVHESGGLITEAYVLPSNDVVLMGRESRVDSRFEDRIGFLFHSPAGSLTGQIAQIAGIEPVPEEANAPPRMSGLLYLYPSGGAASWALVHWDLPHQPHPANALAIERVTMDVESKEPIWSILRFSN